MIAFFFSFLFFPRASRRGCQAPAGRKREKVAKGCKNMKFSMFQKILSILFSALVVFCAAMTGTYTWQDLAQHKSNEFVGLTAANPDESTTEPDTPTTEPDISTTEPDISTTEPDTSTTWPQTSTTQTHATTTTKPGGPKTGDTSNVWLWAILTVLSALGLRGVLLWGRKNSCREGETV